MSQEDNPDQRNAEEFESLFNARFALSMLLVLTIVFVTHLIFAIMGSPLTQSFEYMGVLVGCILIAYCCTKIPHGH